MAERELGFALYQSSKNYWQMLVGFLRGGLQGRDQPALAAVLAYSRKLLHIMVTMVVGDVDVQGPEFFPTERAPVVGEPS